MLGLALLQHLRLLPLLRQRLLPPLQLVLKAAALLETAHLSFPSEQLEAAKVVLNLRAS